MVNYQVTTVQAMQTYLAVRNREVFYGKRINPADKMLYQQYKNLAETLYAQFEDQEGFSPDDPEGLDKTI